ncbi:MAG: glycosyltransferase family 2 protein [Candidatus Nanoarchaeia archaeon]|nr:glycosyltransferase family 2 protein [Candidatus Nanoarchaeia archaeon]
MAEYTFIIPAHNEEKRIGRTLRSLDRFFGDSINVLVVDNGSKDPSVEVYKEWKKEHKNFNYIIFPEALGKGGAVLEGLKIALKDNTKYIGYIDADDAFHLESVKNMLVFLDRYDVVMASKWKDKGFMRVDEPFVRKISSRAWNLLVRLLFGLDVRDTQAGAKFFRREALEKIDFDFICKNFSFDVELLYKLKQNKAKMLEMFIPTFHMEGSTFKMVYVWPMLLNILKLRFGK